MVVFTVAKENTFALIFGICDAVLLGGMLAALLILVYRNQARAKVVAISFLKLEFRSGVELLVDSWDAAGAHTLSPRRPRALPPPPPRPSETASRMPRAAGDIVVLMSVLASVHRPWVAQLLIPYVVCFGVSMLAAFVSFMSKSELRIVPNRAA